jgi:hypothetical protein
VGDVTVAGLGGTYAPTWFDAPAGSLPHRPKDDRRRHFVREEVEACKRLEAVDILMTHEAPRAVHLVDEPKPAARAGRRTREAGHQRLLATLRPGCICAVTITVSWRPSVKGVRSVCIDRINRSYS